ncbi:hypothetical protein D3C72_680250 [compost metagenome]
MVPPEPARSIRPKSISLTLGNSLPFSSSSTGLTRTFSLLMSQWTKPSWCT